MPEGRNTFHPAAIFTTSYLCQQEGQMSILFLKGTWKQAADKPILIKEPACRRELKALPAGVAPPRPASPRARKACAEAERSCRTALLAWHAIKAAPGSPASSPSPTSRSPLSHLQTSSTTALLQTEVAISCPLSRMTCHAMPSESGNICSCLSQHRDDV